MNTNGGQHAPQAPHLALAQLYERTGRNGRRYLVGCIGQLKLMVVETEQVSKGERVWQAFVTENRYSAPAEAVGFVAELAREAVE